MVGTPFPMSVWVPTECPSFTGPVSASLPPDLFTSPETVGVDAMVLIPPGHQPVSIIRFSRGKVVFMAWHEGRTCRSLLPGYK